MKKEKYTLSFKCYNCGHKFTQEIPWGVPVSEANYTRSASIRIETGHCQYIVCPHCGCDHTEKVLEAEK